MPIASSMNTALTGLSTSQRGLQNTAQNIANVNTEGYSRKTAQQVSLTLGGVGAGVTLADVQRHIDVFLVRDLRGATSTLNEREARRDFLGRVEKLLGGPQDPSALGNTMARFRSALEALAAAPESFGLRGEAIRAGRELAEQMNATSMAIQNLRLDADGGVAAGIAAVNRKLAEIAELNHQIGRGLALGQDVTDLLDQRDTAVLAVAEQMQVTTYERADGTLVLGMADGRVMVDGSVPHLLSYSAQNAVVAGTVFNPILLDGANVANRFGGGKIAALIEQRDTTLPARTAELNRLALALRDNVFSATLATTDIVATAGVNEINRFFIGVDPAQLDNAGSIQVHTDLTANPGLLNSLTATRDLANALSSNAIVFGAAGGLPAMTTNLVSYGAAIMSHQASIGAAAEASLTYQSGLHSNLKLRISSVSGVNIDEEMTRMVELQKAYNAAARVVQVSSEMLDVLDQLLR
jgi:flagellar hook-associated protein 1